MFCLGPDASVEIGSYGTLAGPILSTNSRITIGDHALISFQVVLAGNPAPAPFGALARALDERTDTEIHIGENVWIGACAVVLGGASIGDNAIIGAGAVVDFEVPTNAIVA